MDLAELVSRQIRIGDEEFRNRAVRYELPDAPATADPGAGQIVLSRAHHPISVIWE